MTSETADSEEVVEAFAKICELAIALGDVPEGGIEGGYSTVIDDPDTGDPWYIAVNANPGDEEKTRVELPNDAGAASPKPGHALVFYDHVGLPVMTLSPLGGECLVDGRTFEYTEGKFDRSTEDQLIHALDTAIEAAESDARGSE